MPITAIEITNLFCGHRIRHCFDLSVFIYTSNIAFFIDDVKSRYLIYLSNLLPNVFHSFDYFLE